MLPRLQASKFDPRLDLADGRYRAPSLTPPSKAPRGKSYLIATEAEDVARNAHVRNERATSVDEVARYKTLNRTKSISASPQSHLIRSALHPAAEFSEAFNRAKPDTYAAAPSVAGIRAASTKSTNSHG